MNKNVLIFFAVVSSISMTLAIAASLLFTMHSLYLIWTFPPIILFALASSFFVCRYMLIDKERFKRMNNYFARFDPIAAIPNMEVYFPLTIFIGSSIFLLVFSLIMFVGAITQK